MSEREGVSNKSGCSLRALTLCIGTFKVKLLALRGGPSSGPFVSVTLVNPPERLVAS